jgi:hypothetical protein
MLQSAADAPGNCAAAAAALCNILAVLQEPRLTTSLPPAIAAEAVSLLEQVAASPEGLQAVIQYGPLLPGRPCHPGKRSRAL